MAKINGQIESTTRVDKLVKQFIDIRNRIKELEEHHQKQLAPFISAKQRLAGVLLEFLDSTGQEMARTNEGTVYASVRHTASLGDPDAFMSFVMSKGLFELLERRANVTACRDFAEEEGNLPPGVNINSTRTVGVRS